MPRDLGKQEAQIRIGMYRLRPMKIGSHVSIPIKKGTMELPKSSNTRAVAPRLKNPVDLPWFVQQHVHWATYAGLSWPNFDMVEGE